MPIHYKQNFGWSGKSDPEWRYRKTLGKHERDKFDALDEDDRRLIVEEWQLAEVGFKFE